MTSSRDLSQQSEPLRQFDQFKAVFRPKDLDTLRPGSEAWIGRTLDCEAAWIIEPDDGHPRYQGQWACTVQWANDGEHPPFVWVPEEDLEREHSHA